MTDAENIDAAISAILVAIAANPTAVNYSIDGQTVNRNDLYANLEKLQALRATIGGPVEVVSYGVI